MLGCGPVGLAVIAALRLDGVEPIVAADFSSVRRGLAAGQGAHQVVDPREEPAIAAWKRVASGKLPVTFEAVGVPGVIDEAMRAAPRSTRIVVAGVCMEPDTFRPMIGVTKELSIIFSFGYTVDEFSGTLEEIAEGRLDVAPLITGHVGIGDVPRVFDELANPDAHAKILVEPALG